jgi:hypothetical protein
MVSSTPDDLAWGEIASRMTPAPTKQTLEAVRNYLCGDPISLEAIFGVARQIIENQPIYSPLDPKYRIYEKDLRVLESLLINISIDRPKLIPRVLDFAESVRRAKDWLQGRKTTTRETWTEKVGKVSIYMST